MSSPDDPASDSSDDSSTTEDEDAALLTPEAERKWLRAYAAVKLNDPSIYEKNVKFFGDDEDANEDEDEDLVKQEQEESDSEDEQRTKSSASSKPITVKDHERKMLLEKGPALDEDSESLPQGQISKGYYEEQAELKRQLLAAIEDADAATTEAHEEPLIKPRQRSDSERKTDEYNEWLLNRRDSLPDADSARQLEPLRRFWNDPNLDEAERYLRDYLLQKRYLPSTERHDEPRELHEAERDTHVEADAAKIADTESTAEGKQESDRESNFSEKQEEFETKFNFRFEEPDAIFMRRFPRTFASAEAVPQDQSQPGMIRRREESKRAKKRRERSEREALERRAARNQLNRERASQRSDLHRRLSAIRKVSGVNAALLEQVLGESDIDDETEFDPAKYEAKMQRLFGDEFYNEAVDEPSEQQPASNDAESETESDKPVARKAQRATNEEEVKRKLKKLAKESLRERKRFDDAMQRLEARERTLEDGSSVSLPFRYRQVDPCDFGLSTDEVLRARDKELNTWVSSLRMVQYRSSAEEARDRRRYLSSGWQARKTRIIPSLLEPVTPENDATSKLKRPNADDAELDAKKKRKKKQTSKLKETSMETDANGSAKSDELPPSTETNTTQSKKKRKRKHKAKRATAGETVPGDQPEPLDSTIATSAEDATGKPETKPNDAPTKKPKPHTKRARLAVEAVSAKQGSTQKANSKTKQPVKKRKQPAKAKVNDRPALSDARLRAYGIDPKKYKYLPLNKVHSFAEQQPAL